MAGSRDRAYARRMKHVARYLVLLAALFIPASFCASCASVQPYIKAVVTCSGKTVPAALVTEVYTDLMTENWGDLVFEVVPFLTSGYADLQCIIDALKQTNPEVAPKAVKFEKALAKANIRG